MDLHTVLLAVAQWVVLCNQHSSRASVDVFSEMHADKGYMVCARAL